MDVHAAGRGDRLTRRIIALLIALAALAEQLAARSAPVRWLLLWVLRRAEAVAADFVFDVTGMPAPGENIAPVRNSPRDALLLAARLRLLAAALATLHYPDASLPCPSASLGGALRRFGLRIEGLALVLFGWTPEPYDTS